MYLLTFGFVREREHATLSCLCGIVLCLCKRELYNRLKGKTPLVKNVSER